MKTAALAISLLVNIALFSRLMLPGGLTGKAKQSDLPQLISTTNIVDNGSQTTLVAYKDGVYSWAIETNKLTLSVGTRSSIVAYLATNSEDFSTFIFHGVDDQGRRYYVVDHNADGIADRRLVEGDKNFQIVLSGRFYPTVVENQTRYAIVEGKRLPVVYKDGSWEATRN